MEWKIGEIKQVNGEWYQCVESQDGSCKHCDMNFDGKCPIPIKECTESGRSDKSYVIFKKLEKVGEPFVYEKRTCQTYKLHTPTDLKIQPDEVRSISIDRGNYTADIEIKQNKEDVMEKKIQHYDCFFEREQPKPNLKPFDLEAAKAGKPVCTRDGRKARIICFDAEGNKPLIVLSKINGQEVILRYTEKGRSDNFHSPTPREDDLMMLSEKKEGWVNVYKDSVYDTKDEALIGRSESRGYIDTIKINWSE